MSDERVLVDLDVDVSKMIDAMARVQLAWIALVVWRWAHERRWSG